MSAPVSRWRDQGLCSAAVLMPSVNDGRESGHFTQLSLAD